MRIMVLCALGLLILTGCGRAPAPAGAAAAVAENDPWFITITFNELGVISTERFPIAAGGARTFDMGEGEEGGEAGGNREWVIDFYGGTGDGGGR